MIRQQQNVFILDTNNTTYCFQVLPTGHLEHLYYGAKIELTEEAVEVLKEKNPFISGNLISYSEEYHQLGLENVCLEMSSYGKGDIREPFIEIIHGDGSYTSDFLYEGAKIEKGKKPLSSLPSSYAEDQRQVMHLAVTLKDAGYDQELILNYWVFEDCDVITRNAVLHNRSKDNIQLKRLMSMMLDFDESDYQFTNFTGAWAREMNRNDHPLYQGKVVNSSIAGISSNRQNPFVMLERLDTTETAGECYGFNLVYSGNHYEAAEVSCMGKLRLVSGINPEDFLFELKPGAVFEAPEAVMTYSDEGFNGMSQHMHAFVREHIVRGVWKKKERPVLLNSWEAAYFKFDEGKLLKMAKAAARAGIELFVMDDGWFGTRNDDTSSLGDWIVNHAKLPNGMKGFADKIHLLGMQFGIWVEPEMVNENSNLYREHPDWAVRIPGRPHSTGRNQMILDLTREEVRTYVIDSMTAVFESGKIDYVKWDMNRFFSDCYSRESGKNQMEFYHRYTLGLYEVMRTLIEKFPKILFEGCASGGNRFDLGILCYMPQIWASDDTDAVCRETIQTGYSYGYPMSVISAHVSDCPNHQTLRNTSIETRFNVAAFGILGYECNLCELPEEELKAVAEQIALYKKYRRTLQFGQYYRLKSGVSNSYIDHVFQWITVAEDKTQAAAFYGHGRATPNYPYGKMMFRGLDPEKIYEVKNRFYQYNIKEFGGLINMVAPIHVKKNSFVHTVISKVMKVDGEKECYRAGGNVLNCAGIKLNAAFSGAGYNEEVRLFKDYASRIYLIDEVEPK